MINSAIVADIKRGSLEDGAGFRTVIFFKGCPLDCIWCHNPECKNREIETLLYPEKCIGCNMCEKGCFSGAKVLCGKQMTASEIFSEILRDKEYYGKDGGVTFSGGEPLIYKEIIMELIALCKEENINTAIETSLYLFDEKVLKNLDFVMADFKIFDNELHKKYTGVSNESIKENFKKLDKLNVPFLVRTPIIPTINDNVENIVETRNFIRVFKNIKGYELLPYHPLGISKSKALGLEAIEFSVPSKEKMEELNSYANL